MEGAESPNLRRQKHLSESGPELHQGRGSAASGGLRGCCPAGGGGGVSLIMLAVLLCSEFSLSYVISHLYS
jgi:hypothetical protein